MAEQDVSIALNRFGLGARPDQPLPSDARAWLTEQFGRYQAKPKEIAQAPDTHAVATDMATYFEQVRLLRQQATMDARYAPPPKPKPVAPPTASPMTAQMSAMAMGGATTAGTGAPPPMMAPAPAAAAPMDDGAKAQQMAERAYAARLNREYYGLAVGARANQALITDTPFVERLVHFWANHFAVSIDKFDVVGLSGTFEFEAIRPHVLGRFGDMLNAVERHPAMLLFLDQAQSVGPDSPLGARIAARGNRKIGLNENLAREIMELHTLGVRSGYTQADVTEFARAMTGWTVSGIGRGPGARALGMEGPPGDYVFVAATHQPGTRTIRGKQYPQDGQAQAQAVLDDLAVDPATATHLATKLARHFAGDNPPPAMVNRLKAAFLSSQGDLPTVYRALINSPEAWKPGTVKFKTPWEWYISTNRALGTTAVSPVAATGLMNQLGQPIWRPGSPAGYDDIAGSWAGPDAVMRRVEAAERFASRAPATLDARALGPKLFPAALTPQTTQALARAESPAQALALLLVAPEAMRR